MYSLLGQDVLALCDKFGSYYCTMKVVLTEICQDHLSLDVSDFTQLVDVSGSFWHRYIRTILCCVWIRISIIMRMESDLKTRLDMLVCTDLRVWICK